MDDENALGCVWYLIAGFVVVLIILMLIASRIGL